MTLARRKTCLKQITGQKKYLSLCLGYIVRTTNSSTPPLEVCEGFTHQRTVWMDKQKEKKKKEELRTVEWHFLEPVFIPHFRSRFSTDCRSHCSFSPVLYLGFCSFLKPLQPHTTAVHRGQRAHQSTSLRCTHRPKRRYCPVKEPEFLRITLSSFWKANPAKSVSSGPPKASHELLSHLEKRNKLESVTHRGEGDTRCTTTPGQFESRSG